MILIILSILSPGMTPDDMAAVFDEWNKGELDSFLIEITAKILRFKDESGEPLVEKIRDTAGQKGTGKWTAIAGLDNGIPVTLIGELNELFIGTLSLNLRDFARSIFNFYEMEHIHSST